jgi:hypothetical protein
MQLSGENGKDKEQRESYIGGSLTFPIEDQSK